MKIGIYNIFTFFWFVLMMILSGTLTYFLFNKNDFKTDTPIFIKIILGIFSILFVAILIYFLYKLRILLVSKKNIISIYPFLFKFERIEISKIKSIKWENFIAFKATVYKKVKIKDDSKTIVFSDLEFENFEILVKELNIGSEKKFKIQIEQAKANINDVKFNLFTNFGLLIFLLATMFMNKINLIIVIFEIIIVIFIIAFFKRYLNYKKLLKNT